jgi:uncharacterized protein YkwD
LIAFLILAATAIAPEALAQSAVAGSDFDAALLAGINAVRAEQGLPALKPDPRLAAAARQQSQLMARALLMEHEIAGMPNFPQRLRAAKARVRTAGENILRDRLGRYGLGCGSAGPAAREIAQVSVGRWVGSPKHRANILNPRFKRAGASFAVVVAQPGCGEIYVTQVFGG